MKIRFVLIVFVFLLLALYAAFIHQDDTITQAQAGYATLIVMLGALPGVVSLIDRREAGLLPPCRFTVSSTCSPSGCRSFPVKMDWSRVNSAVITDTLVLTILGLICLYLGYYASRGLYSRSLRPIRFLNDVPLSGG